MQRSVGIVLWILLFFVGRGLAGQPQSSRNFQLTLSREYGLSVFQQCRLNLVFYDGQGTASVYCLSTALDGRGRPVPSPSTTQKLTAIEVTQITDLVERSALYGGGNVGRDDTASDGIFETLKVNGSGGTAVVVTSGNRTFVQIPARQELLAILRALETRMVERAREK